MVQGKVNSNSQTSKLIERDYKLVGFEEMKKRQQPATQSSKDKRVDSSSKTQSNGSWGQTFKNREHFNSMHHC